MSTEVPLREPQEYDSWQDLLASEGLSHEHVLHALNVLWEAGLITDALRTVLLAAIDCASGS